MRARETRGGPTRSSAQRRTIRQYAASRRCEIASVCMTHGHGRMPGEPHMSDTEVIEDAAAARWRARSVDLKLEVVVIPVADVDRAKRFYGGLGWRLDADIARGDA